MGWLVKGCVIRPHTVSWSDFLKGGLLVFVLTLGVSPHAFSQGLNKELGAPIWEKPLLWQNKASDVAKRVGLQRSGDGVYQADFWPAGRRVVVLGHALLRVHVYATSNDRVKDILLELSHQNVSVLYRDQIPQPAPNEGAAAKKRRLEKTKKVLEKASKEALGKLERTLNRKCGTPKKYKNGMRIWSYAGHKIKMTPTLQVVSLRISQASSEDVGALTSVTANKVRRNVIKRNGDIVIKNIPQISQGNRGYCLPASTEKYVRYLNLSLDITELADIGRTSALTGTHVFKFFDKLKPFLDKRGYRIGKVRGDPHKISTLKPYIDKGYPIIWGMDFKYVESWITRTQTRTTRLNEDPLREGQRGGHAILIIGYKEDGSEICLSDSTELGVRTPEIWVKASEVKEVDLKFFPLYVLLPKKGLESKKQYKPQVRY